MTRPLGGSRGRKRQALEERAGFGRPGRSGKDCFRIVFQQLQPVRQILGMIRAQLRGDLKLGAQERRADLGHQLLGGIGGIAEARASFCASKQISCCSLGRSRRALSITTRRSRLRTLISPPPNQAPQPVSGEAQSDYADVP